MRRDSELFLELSEEMRLGHEYGICDFLQAQRSFIIGFDVFHRKLQPGFLALATEPLSCDVCQKHGHVNEGLRMNDTVAN